MIQTDAIDRLFVELSQFTRATTAKERKLIQRIDELRKEVYDLKWLVHESANRFETIRDTHPSIDTEALVTRLREKVPDIEACQWSAPGNQAISLDAPYVRE